MPVTIEKRGQWTLEIKENPAGYSEGTWGYVVRNDAGDMSFDGGYASREHAIEVGLARLKEKQ